MSEAHSREQRIKNQQLARTANQQFLSYAQGFFEALPIHDVGFSCECDRGNCQELLQLSNTLYESIHQYGNRFVVMPGHEQLDIEMVIDKYHGFLVVEKPDLSA